MSRLIDADALIAKAYIMQEPNGFIHSVVTERQIVAAPTIDAVPVVRCEKCLWYKPAHFRADDGTETPWDGTISLGMSDGRKGIYIGGKCKHERNTSYGETDKAFRKPDDFCSYGERRSKCKLY